VTKYISKIAVFTLIFISNFFVSNILCAVTLNKEIRAQDLNIFNILTNAKIVLMEDLARHHNGTGIKVGVESDAKTAAKVLVEQEIALLCEIVSGFNSGLLSAIEFKFLGICNFFNNFEKNKDPKNIGLENIEPRNIRAFKRKLIQFDNFIQKHCLNKKSSFGKDEFCCVKKSQNLTRFY